MKKILLIFSILLLLCVDCFAGLDVPSPPGRGTYQELNSSGGITVGGSPSVITGSDDLTITTDGDVISYGKGQSYKYNLLTGVKNGFVAEYTTDIDDFIVVPAPVAATFSATLVLPNVTVVGQILIVKNLSVVNTVSGFGGATIDGRSSVTLGKDESDFFVWNGTEWKVIAKVKATVVNGWTVDTNMAFSDRNVIVTTSEVTLDDPGLDGKIVRIRAIGGGASTIVSDPNAIEGTVYSDGAGLSLASGSSLTLMFDPNQNDWFIIN